MTDKKCAISSCTSVASDKFIICNGPCNKMVHLGCVKLNNAAYPMFATKNVKWFCDDCCLLYDKFVQQMETMMNVLQSLSSDVKRLVNSCPERRITRQATKRLPSEVEENVNPISQVNASASKSVHTDLPDTHTTNNGVNYIIGSCVDDSIKSVPERKYIYASRFVNSTTSDAIKKFLNNKLQIPEEDIDCRLLLAANQDVTKYNFISFKIGISPAIFKQLLQPDVWPVGVLIREFIDRPKNLRVPVSIQ